MFEKSIIKNERGKLPNLAKWKISWIRLVRVASVVSDSATLWTVACQVPLSMGILQARILEWVSNSLSGFSLIPLGKHKTLII